MKKIKTIICLFLLMFSSLITTSCFNNNYAIKQEYMLEDRYEIYEGVKYYYSSLGLIAKEIVSDVEEVSVYPMVNNELVYSVATNFLKDNDVIQTLNLPNAPIIYESKCISNCTNLKTINFVDMQYEYQELNPKCEKNAFELEKDCYIYIHNISQIQHYVYAFNSYVNKFKLLNPVKVRFALSSVLSGSEYTVKDKTLYFSVKGKLFNLIDIDASQSYSLGDVWDCAATIKLIDDVDFFINNYKKIKKQEFEVTTNAYYLAKKNIVSGIITKDYPVSSNKNEKLEQLYTSIDRNVMNITPGILVTFTTTFSYYENK